MNQASKLKEKVIHFNCRDEALVFIAKHADFSSYDFTEGLESITSIFVFKDDSTLRIDTENFVYCDDEREITPINKWKLNPT